MQCHRCSGLMIEERFFDYVLGVRIPQSKCVNCGNVEDRYIIANRGVKDQTSKFSRWRKLKLHDGPGMRGNSDSPESAS